MFMVLKLLLCLCLVGLSYAKSEAEIRNYFIGIALECNKETPISAEDMMTLHQHKIPDNETAKCLLACVFRKAKWMDAKGMFDVDAVHGFLEKEHFDDATKQESSKKLIEICKKVNEETVSDGEKGCQRGALLTMCLTENAPKVGLNLVV
ncbi:hypothetical protein O0L34_g13971 [Tuta absoluta]|nr:hypothetical protein O0L34_g13971 [Tuta absoluta]